MPQMANFVYNMYMHLIQTTHHYHQVSFLGIDLLLFLL